MNLLVKLSLLLLTLSLLSAAWLSYTLFLESALLKGAHTTLKGRYQQSQKELKRSQRALQQSQRELKSSRQKLAQMEAEKPKGVRKLANRASKIPLLGTLPTAGLLAADLWESLTHCYHNPEVCRAQMESLYREGEALVTP